MLQLTWTTFWRTSRVPVQRFLSHWPRSHIASRKGICACMQGVTIVNRRERKPIQG